MNLTILFAFLVIFWVHFSEGVSRVHKAGKNGKMNVVVGHGLTSFESEPVERSLSFHPESRKLEKPHVVDFALYLKRDIIIWDELEKDNVSISACGFGDNRRYITMELRGGTLQKSDFEKGVVLIIEQANLELLCGKAVPKFKTIDSTDSYMFLAIKALKLVHENSINITLKIIPGKRVVPIVDLSVRKEEASESDIKKYQNIKYDDEEMGTDEPKIVDIATRFANSSLSLPYSNHLSLSNKRIFVDKGVNLVANANVNVKISSFRLLRKTGFHFAWDQKLEGFFNTELQLDEFLTKARRSGSVVRWYIPGLSFSINIPVAGKFKAGAFVGIDWVTAMEIGVSATIKMRANYKKHERVTAKLVPPSYKAINKQNGGSYGSVSIAAKEKKNFRVSGFFGVRPLIAAGITYKKRKVLFKGWKPKIVTVSKDINGNVGADVGTEIGVVSKSRLYLPYKGSESTIGTCDNCHFAQGAAYFKGKSLTAQTVVGGTVLHEKVVLRSMFVKKLGRVCLLPNACPTRK